MNLPTAAELRGTNLRKGLTPLVRNLLLFNLHFSIAALPAAAPACVLSQENTGPALGAADGFSGKSAAFGIINFPDLHWLPGLLLLLGHYNHSLLAAAAFFTLGLFLAKATLDSNDSTP